MVDNTKDHSFSRHLKWREYAHLMRWHQPIGALLLLWPTLWALWMASNGIPEWRWLLVFIAGVWIMRSAGCVINDLWDRDIDPHVERTAQRPLAAGTLSVRQARRLFSFLCLLAFALALMLPKPALLLAFPAMALTISYPLMKRHIHLPQAVLGIAFGWAVPMAFATVEQRLPPASWLLLGATIVWAMVYDTEYAISDREEDQKLAVKSSAIFFGAYDRLVILGLQGLMLILLVGAGMVLQRSIIYYFGLFLAAGLFIYQQQLIRYRQPNACQQAFRNNNWVGMVIFIAIVLDYSHIPMN